MNTFVSKKTENLIEIEEIWKRLWFNIDFQKIIKYYLGIIIRNLET